ncbi:uncharacterized protein LOC130820142 isoform X2 [Amaranthus tricolor]|uniref:uncharacterized protein LOC130820142 isoform X2 n=1 Tax=Amaranthus tricolor TaxID=29722 RepID=UPI0025912835|nr:uncharacterized protein LOC130820142 isoform X2 [Amaranthus tricolor]
MEEKFQLVSSTEFEEEEFYEEIEAPKFVDFTLPDHFCPDDRFWFCSRVGCDRRHEKEMDSEAINKNFVLRVMAARSPNVLFQRAITRKPLSDYKKCPVSAPPKSSKSRLPRLAIVSSSISKKLFHNDKKGKQKLPASTPNVRVKHVAAKYMTSPRMKKGSSPKGNAFRSVRNAKKSSISLPKSKVMAKALVFNSPKKAALGKKNTLMCKQSKDCTSERKKLSTPITKLCEGVKNLQINTQKKGVIQKKLPFDGSREKPSSYMAQTRENEAKSSRSVKSKTKLNHKKLYDKLSDDSSDMEIDEKSRPGETSSSERPTTGCETFVVLSAISQKSEIDSGLDSDSKISVEENFMAIPESNEAEQHKDVIEDDVKNQNPDSEMNSGSEPVSKVSAEENTTVIQELYADEKENGNTIAAVLKNKNSRKREQKDNDEKENVRNTDNIRNLNSNSKNRTPMEPKVNTKQFQQKQDKILKENCPARSGTQTLKNRKLKPTNPKPFRLRTDERGVLKEATLERKATYFENSSHTSENSQGTGNGVSENKTKGSKKDESTGFKKEQPAFARPIRSRYKTLKEVEPKSEKSSGKTKSSILQKKLKVPTREIVSGEKPRGLEVTEKTEATVSKRKKPRKQGKDTVDSANKASVAPKSAAQGKTVTTSREPRFHSLHKPKSCTANKPYGYEVF